MNSKEIISRVINHNQPPRFGYNFNNENYNDLSYVQGRSYINNKPNPYSSWGKHKELLELTGFTGEVFRDGFGNIYGRFEGKTKGECIRGVLQDWSDFDNYAMPEIDRSYRQRLLDMNLEKSDKYLFCGLSSLFSQLRDARLMENALADTVLEPEMVKAFLERIVKHEVEVIKLFAGCGIDAALIGDDWGTQESTFVSPDCFRELFKPYYKKIADTVHDCGMKILMHSCGYNYGFIEDLIDAGIDVFQFDQPDAYPAETLANEFGKRVTFWSPVDIQKVLPTGNRELIEKRALDMCKAFNSCGGGFIAKDYPTYNDIGVKQEWAEWARDVIIQNSRITKSES